MDTRRVKKKSNADSQGNFLFLIKMVPQAVVGEAHS